MTHLDIQNIATLFYTHVYDLEQKTSVIRGENQVTIHQLNYVCDVIDAFYTKVLVRTKFKTLSLHHWREACLRGKAVFPPTSEKEPHATQ